MIVTFNGQTWGTHNPGQDGTYVLRAPGLEGWSVAAGSMTNNRDGATVAVSRINPRAFTITLLVLQDDYSGMASAMSTLMTALYPSDDRTALLPLTFTLDGQSARTVFARVTDVQLPTEFATNDRYRSAEVVVAFESPDPQTYTTAAGTEVSLDPTDTVAPAGTIASSEGRWQAVIAGPATNPQLASSIASTAVARYVGTIASGSNLVLHVSPGYLLAKVVTDADLADVEIIGVGTNAYESMDRGASASNRPPFWFPITSGSQTITYTTASGAGVCTFTYWVPVA